MMLFSDGVCAERRPRSLRRSLDSWKGLSIGGTDFVSELEGAVIKICRIILPCVTNETPPHHHAGVQFRATRV